ncbi:DMT family transporter [Gluconacetobacter asukensis]|uniref:DMT family transporter n=1 Tax=Gluconacetobacter asukensis TaxID=1017181 RepID=A0A7W4J3V8_9PROT|nr:DMT family transporter [Gluconacetobacter asukensis]MBB2174032.1 DMT family transporter [Gluconacetobacter asukensis]
MSSVSFPVPLVAGLAYGVAAGACWGVIFLAPLLVPDFSPFQLSEARYIAYGVMSGVLLLPRWRSVAGRIPVEGWGGLFCLGVIGNIAYYVLVGAAVRLTGIATTAIITGFLPVLIAVFGMREPGALQARTLWPSLLLMITGITLTGMGAFGHAAGGTSDWVHRAEGMACAAAGLGSWTAFAILNARWMRRLPDVGAGEWGLATGVATGLLGLAALPFAGFGSGAHATSCWLGFIGVSIGVAVIASVLGGTFWNACSRRLPMTLSGQMAVGETLFALLYGCLWSDHGLSGVQIVAVILLIGSVAISAVAHRNL